MASPVRRILSTLGLMAPAPAPTAPASTDPPSTGPGTTDHAAERRRFFALGYHAGKKLRSSPDWNPSAEGPNAKAEHGRSLEMAVRRSRDLADSSELIAGAVDRLTEKAVGDGLQQVEAATGFAELDRQLDSLWQTATRRVNHEGTRTLGEDQALFLRELILAGSVGVYRHFAEAFGDFPGGPAIELVAVERLPLDLSGTEKSTGNPVRQGVEYDRRGRVVAYHVLTQQPDDEGSVGGFGRFAGTPWTGRAPGDRGVQRIPADRMELVFRDTRLDQLRGVPRTLAMIKTAHRVDTLVELVMDRVALEAGMGIFFEVDNPALFAAAADQRTDAERALMARNNAGIAVDGDGIPVTSIAGVNVGYVPQGTKVHPTPVVSPSGNLDALLTRLLKGLSRATGLAYGSFAGDWAGTSFSAGRLDKLDERAAIRSYQRLIWTHHTEPWRRDLIRFGLATGVITLEKLSAADQAALAANPDRLYACAVVYPGEPYSNPKDEAAANEIDIRSGVKSAVEAIQERGGDWRATARLQAAYEAAVEAERAKLGLKPKPAPAAPAPPADAKEEDSAEDGQDPGEPVSDRRARLGLNGTGHPPHPPHPPAHPRSQPGARR